MADKSLLELPLATSIGNALVYGVQNNQDVAIPAQLFGQDSEPVPANTFYAGPISPPGGLPAFRPLIAADIPDLSNVYLKSNNGTLVSPTINNAQIVGGSLSGVVGTFDDDKLIVRNVTDTTKRARWNMAPIPAGNLAVFSVPPSSTTLVGTDSDQTLTNKKIVAKASTSASSGLTLPTGVTPSSPVDGDVWITAAGMYARVSGSTVGPFAPALSSAVTSFNGRTGAISLSSGDVTSALGYTPYNTASEQYVRKTGDSMSGSLNINASLTTQSVRAFGGTFGTQIGLISRGYNNAVTRWLDVLESDGSLSIYAYNTTGAQPNQLVNYKTVVTGGSNSASFTGRLGTVGSSSSVFFTERDSSTQWEWYASSGAARLWRAGSGDRLQVSPQGDVSINGFVQAGALTNNIGKSTLHPAEAGRSGFVSFTQSNGVRIGFIGYGSGTTINAATENGYNTWAFTGSVTATGGFGPGSDPRLKDEESLEEVHDAVERVYNLNVRKGRYKDWYNDDGKDRLFLMADNAMEQYAPTVFQKGLIDKDGEKYNGWSADQMIALLVKTVQELTDRIEDLEGRLDEQQD